MPAVTGLLKDPGFGAGWFSVANLYKWGCVYIYGGASNPDVPGSLKWHFFIDSFGVGLKPLTFYRVFLHEDFGCVYFDLGAMQVRTVIHGLMLSSTRRPCRTPA